MDSVTRLVACETCKDFAVSCLRHDCDEANISIELTFQSIFFSRNCRYIRVAAVMLFDIHFRRSSPLQVVTDFHHKFPISSSTCSILTMRHTAFVLFLATAVALLSREKTTILFRSRELTFLWKTRITSRLRCTVLRQQCGSCGT